MKIALFYNLPPGGAKRALFEHVRHLRARGYVVDAYLPSTATEAYLPLDDLCQQIFRYPVPPSRKGRLSRFLQHPRLEQAWNVVGAFKRDLMINALLVRQQAREAHVLDHLYRQIAADMQRRYYDLAYVHQCIVQQSPSLLRHLTNLPAVYYCQDTIRYVYEWSSEEHAQYDAVSRLRFLDKQRGNFYPAATLRLWREKEREYVRNTRAANRVLANSWYSREAIVRTTGVNASVCYLGVDADYFCPPPPGEAPARERLVLSVGGLLPHKRHDFILDAIATIPERRRPRMEIIGYEMAFGAKGLGPIARGLLARAEEKRVDLKIHKDVSDEALRDGYRRAAVFAFAPYLEPFGFVPLEAMACGTPVVGVSEGGLRESIQDGVTGLLTGRDPHEFGRAIQCLLDDPDRAARMGAAGRDDVRARWTWERSVDALETQFTQTLAAAGLW